MIQLPLRCSQSSHNISKLQNPCFSEHRIERQGNPTGEANLASMSMPADQHVKISIGRLPIDFRSMGYQNGELIGRDPSYSLFYIVHSVKMGVIDADKMDAL